MPNISPSLTGITNATAVSALSKSSFGNQSSAVGKQAEKKSDYFDRVISDVAKEHPDLGALKAETSRSVPSGTSDTQIDKLAFDQFKRTDEFKSFVDSMHSANETLTSVFDKNPTSQRIVKKALRAILDRLAFVNPDTERGLKGNRIMVAEHACLPIKQVAALVKEMQTNPHPELDASKVLGKVEDFLLNISAEAEICGPGLTEKVVDEFRSLKNTIFPPSLKEAVNHKRLETGRQILNQFVNEHYVAPGHIPAGNAVHYVNVWQNRISQSSPAYSFLPLIDTSNDPYAPILVNDSKNQSFQLKLESQLNQSANCLHACINIAESIQQSLVSNLGNNAADINQNFGEFQATLKIVQGDYPFLQIEDFIQSDGGYGYTLRNRPDNIAIKLLTELNGTDNPPKVIANIDGITIKQLDGAIWSERVDSETDQTNIDTDLNLTKLNLTKLSRFVDLNNLLSAENLGKALPVIAKKFASSSNSEKMAFLNRCFSGNFNASEGSVSLIKTPADASMFLATIIHHQPASLQNPQISNALAQTGFSIDAVLSWNATRAPQLGISLGENNLNGLIRSFVSNAPLSQVLSQASSWNSASMAEKVALAAKEQTSQKRTFGGLGATQWEKAMSHAKATALNTGCFSSYMGLKAAKSGNGSLQKLRPQVFQEAIKKGDQNAAIFALQRGANANGMVRQTSRNVSFTPPVSHLQLAISSNMPAVVASLLDNGANLYAPIVPQPGLHMTVLDFARNTGNIDTIRAILTALVQTRDIYSMHYQLELDKLDMAQARFAIPR